VELLTPDQVPGYKEIFKILNSLKHRKHVLDAPNYPEKDMIAPKTYIWRNF